MDALTSAAAFATERPLLSATGAVVVGALAVAYLDYRSYVALGPHGLPDTFQGWLTQLKMVPKSRKDTTVPAPYHLDSVAGPHDKTSFLPKTHAGGLSWRPGSNPPRVVGFVAPQRQTTEQASVATKKAMYGYLDALVAVNSEALQTQTSVLEGPVPAMGMQGFAKMSDSEKPQVLRSTRGEMCHIHPPDGSTHLVMSLADQKRVIELGWGRRHRLSGGPMLPWNYTFIYAPRNEEEIESWKSIVTAAAKFCCADVCDIQAPGV